MLVRPLGWRVGKEVKKGEGVAEVGQAPDGLPRPLAPQELRERQALQLRKVDMGAQRALRGAEVLLRVVEEVAGKLLF